MNITIDDLGTLVAAQLTAAAITVPFSQPFTCLMDDTPLFTADELTNLKVTILPFRFQPAPGKPMPGQQKPHRFRNINEYQYVLSLGIQQKGPNLPISPPDPIRAFSAGLRLLIQELLHWLNKEGRRPILDPAGTSLWLKTIDVPELYNVALLRNTRTFSSYCWLTYEEFVRE